MSDKTLHDLLKSTFQKTDKQDWLKAAESEVKTGHPQEVLRWGNEHGLTFQPIYDKNDLQELNYLDAFSLTQKKSMTGARNWLNLPVVVAVDELKANNSALNHLTNGADGILFDLQNFIPNFSKLLNLIDWSFCSVSFIISSTEQVSALSKYIAEKKYDSSAITGTLFSTKLPAHCETFLSLFKEEKKIDCLGLIISPSSPIQEISSALISAVTLIDLLTEKGIDANAAIRNVSFSLPTGTNFFLEIGKFKALRMLWFQVAQSYGVKDYKPSDVHLHARSEIWLKEEFQPNGNMLKSTSSSMAAIMGGCDSLTVYAEEQENMMMNRIARNVSNILLDETHLNVVADPIAGSYAVENLVNEIAQKAWHEFVINMK